MNDDQLDRLVRQAQPPAATAGSRDLGRGEQELLEEILSTPVTPSHTATGAPEPLELPMAQPVPLRRRRRVLIGVAAAAAFAAAIAGPTIALRGGDRAAVSPGTSTPAPQPTLAGSNPGLLLDDPDWKITHVDEDSATDGEMTFTKGQNQLDVNWSEASEYRSTYNDRLDVSEPGSVPALGRTGALFTYSPTEYAVILPPRGASFLEIRGSAGDKAAFTALLAQLEQVPAAQWLAALPDSVVTPARAPALAEEMMAGVPWPAGIDRTPLPTDRIMDSYQFGAAVATRVGCAWLERYTEVRKAHDTAGMAEVATVLSTSDRWKVFELMDQGGDFHAVLDEVFEPVAEGRSVGEYRGNLGCDD